MPVKIALRTSPCVSHARRYLMELVTAEGQSASDRGVLLANYEWHDMVLHTQPPVLAMAFTQHCDWIRTIADSRPSNVSGTSNYSNFLRVLKGWTRSYSPTPPRIDYFLSNLAGPYDHRWHAKIAIRVLDGVPVAALIGSSNLTCAAYLAPPTTQRNTWNTEADVVIWRDTDDLNRQFLQDAVRDLPRTDAGDLEDDTFEVVAEEITGGAVFRGMPLRRRPTVEYQLDWLYNELLKAPYSNQPSWTV